MALDEVLLQQALRDRTPTLRFYAWSEATLSLGYFQPWADRYQHPASRHCPVVRRASGGGAILHDHELTYSFAVPIPEVVRGRPTELYRSVHSSLLSTLEKWGVRGTLFGSRPEIHDEFLCFQRRSPGDVLLGDHKIAGSAQRRAGSAVLQHGSLLLRSSANAAHLAGIREIAAIAVSRNEFARVWSDQLRQALGLDAYASGFSDRELGLAQHLVATRFGNPKWIFRR